MSIVLNAKSMYLSWGWTKQMLCTLEREKYDQFNVTMAHECTFNLWSESSQKVVTAHINASKNIKMTVLTSVYSRTASHIVWNNKAAFV